MVRLGAFFTSLLGIVWILVLSLCMRANTGWFLTKSRGLIVSEQRRLVESTLDVDARQSRPGFNPYSEGLERSQTSPPRPRVGECRDASCFSWTENKGCR